MPCYDERNDPAWVQRSEERQFGDTKLNITTRLACEYLSKLESSGAGIPEWAERWWKHHKSIDAARGAC